MNFRNALFLSIFTLGTLFVSGAQAANLVADGSFSTPYGGSSYTTYNAGSSIGPWNVTSGSVDLIGGYWQNPSSPDVAAPYGSVDLDGNNPGAITQTLNLNPGNYALTFSLSGNPDGGNPLKTVQASIAGASNSFTYTTGSNSRTSMNYIVETLDFSVVGSGPQSTLLSFVSLDDARSPWGPVIGNVAVSAVPLPAALPLFASLLVALGAFGYYRRRQVM